MAPGVNQRKRQRESSTGSAAASRGRSRSGSRDASATGSETSAEEPLTARTAPVVMIDEETRRAHMPPPFRGPESTAEVEPSPPLTARHRAASRQPSVSSATDERTTSASSHTARGRNEEATVTTNGQPAVGGAMMHPAEYLVKLPHPFHVHASFYSKRRTALTMRAYDSAAARYAATTTTGTTGGFGDDALVVIAVDTPQGTAAKLFNVLHRGGGGSAGSGPSGTTGGGQVTQALAGDLWSFVSSVPPSLRNFYVVVDPSLPVDAFFDLDFNMSTSPSQLFGLMNNATAAATESLSTSATATSTMPSVIKQIEVTPATIIAGIQHHYQSNMKQVMLEVGTEGSDDATTGKGAGSSLTTMDPEASEVLLGHATTVEWQQFVLEVVVRRILVWLDRFVRLQAPTSASGTTNTTTSTSSASSSSESMFEVALFNSCTETKLSAHLHLRHRHRVAFQDIKSLGAFVQLVLLQSEKELYETGAEAFLKELQAASMASSTASVAGGGTAVPPAAFDATSVLDLIGGHIQREFDRRSSSQVPSLTTQQELDQGTPSMLPAWMEAALVLSCVDGSVYSSWRLLRLPGCSKRLPMGKVGASLLWMNPDASIARNHNVGISNDTLSSNISSSSVDSLTAVMSIEDVVQRMRHRYDALLASASSTATTSDASDTSSRFQRDVIWSAARIPQDCFVNGGLWELLHRHRSLSSSSSPSAAAAGEHRVAETDTEEDALPPRTIFDLSLICRHDDVAATKAVSGGLSPLTLLQPAVATDSSSSLPPAAGTTDTVTADGWTATVPGGPCSMYPNYSTRLNYQPISGVGCIVAPSGMATPVALPAFRVGKREVVTDLHVLDSMKRLFQLLHPTQYLKDLGQPLTRVEREDTFTSRFLYGFQKQSKYCCIQHRAHKDTFGQLCVTFGSVKYRCYSNDCHHLGCKFLFWPGMMVPAAATRLVGPSLQVRAVGGNGQVGAMISVAGGSNVTTSSVDNASSPAAGNTEVPPPRSDAPRVDVVAILIAKAQRVLHPTATPTPTTAAAASADTISTASATSIAGCLEVRPLQMEGGITLTKGQIHMLQQNDYSIWWWLNASLQAAATDAANAIPARAPGGLKSRSTNAGTSSSTTSSSSAAPTKHVAFASGSNTITAAQATAVALEHLPDDTVIIHSDGEFLQAVLAVKRDIRDVLLPPLDSIELKRRFPWEFSSGASTSSSSMLSSATTSYASMPAVTSSATLLPSVQDSAAAEGDNGECIIVADGTEIAVADTA